MMLMSAGMYVFNHEEISALFEAMHYPAYVVYPLAALKVLGLIAIWTRLSTTLTYFAYAGFLYDFILAFFAHYIVSDGEHGGAMVAITLWLVSFTYYKKLFA